MRTITIDIECRDGMTKHFCTIVCDVSEVHKALMDSVNFITSIGWKYIGHTITVQEPKGNVFEEGTEIGIDVLTAMRKSAEAVKNSPQYDFSCVTSLFGEKGADK